MCVCRCACVFACVCRVCVCVLTCVCVSLPATLPPFQERASFHRQQLKQRLGLVAQGKVFSTGIERLFEDSDLIVSTEVKTSTASKHHKVVLEVVRRPTLDHVGVFQAVVLM